MGSTATPTRPLVPAGMEIKAATASPDAKASASVLVGHQDETGVVEAFVSVTGVVDEVQDVIVPGAYADTLVKRKPKGVFSHDWNRWVARTEEIEEWLPGDPRIAQKMAEAGKPMLPAEAGVLYVKTRFNLKTDEGRNAYENVVFFSETGECEWSIGYLVPPGKSTRDKAGVRHIKSLDLYEYSPVLFGAAPLSTSLSVKGLAFGKSATGHQAIPTSPLADVLAALGRKSAQAVADEDQAVADLHAAAEGEIDWDAVDAATASMESKYLALDEKTKDSKPGDGNAESLRRWYVAGEGAAKIKWGTDGDLTRCHRIAAKHMSPDRAWGYCQLRHRDALGEFNPESGGGEKKAARQSSDFKPCARCGSTEVTDLDGPKQPKCAKCKFHLALKKEAKGGLPEVEPASALLDHYDPAAEVKAGALRPQDETPPAGGKPVDDQVAGEHDTLDEPQDDVLESKEFPFLAGSYEERNNAIRRAIDQALGGQPVESPEGDPVPMGGRREWDYVEIVATFPDRVIARRSRWSNGLGAGAEETWEVGYQFDADGDVVLDEPEQVTLQVTTNVVHEDVLPDVPEAVYAGVDAVSVGIKAMAEAMQTKAGRVLSSANETRLRQAVEHLVHVLRAAGVQISPVGADTQHRGDVAHVDTTAPVGAAPVAVEGKSAGSPEHKGTGSAMRVAAPDVVAAGLTAFLDAMDEDEEP